MRRSRLGSGGRVRRERRQLPASPSATPSVSSVSTMGLDDVPPSPAAGVRPMLAASRSFHVPHHSMLRELMPPGSAGGGPPERWRRSSDSSRHFGDDKAEHASLLGTSASAAALPAAKMPTNVRVVVRLRPLNDVERADGETEIVSPSDGGSGATVAMPAPGGRTKRKTFKLDGCLAPDVDQDGLFQNCGVKQLLTSALDGYAATVFAYGQTGSGKTYSLSGLEERLGSVGSDDGGSAGLIPRSVAFLFDEIAAREGTTYTVHASFCEIYNEQVFDLLHPDSGNLPVRWGSDKGFYVQGLLVVEVESLDDIKAVMAEGHRNRRIGSHELNLDSSRSHSLLTVTLTSETVDPDDGHTVLRGGKVVFVDLAGSERLRDSKSEGLARKETSSINRSLFVLGKVISSLSEGKSSHVPYRDSKLTKLLMDSLGGKSMTLMIACCSPAKRYMEETLSTLGYAQRTRSIHNKPEVLMDAKEKLISNLRREIGLLRMENDHLKAMLRMPPPPPGMLPPGMRPPPHAMHMPPGSPVMPPPGTPIMMGMHMMPHSPVPMGMPRRRRARTVEGSSPVPGSTGRRRRAAPAAAPARSPAPHAAAAGKADAAALQRMLDNYRREVELLRKEASDLRASEQKATKAHEAVMAENERLRAKVEHLERVFMSADGGDGSSWPTRARPSAAGSTAAAAAAAAAAATAASSATAAAAAVAAAAAAAPPSTPTTVIVSSPERVRRLSASRRRRAADGGSDDDDALSATSSTSSSRLRVESERMRQRVRMAELKRRAGVVDGDSPSTPAGSMRKRRPRGGGGGGGGGAATPSRQRRPVSLDGKKAHRELLGLRQSNTALTRQVAALKKKQDELLRRLGES
eukprot:PLAT9066.1.p1 GENE.PLAT9066.1~~PLAT9066.1.p1  ORF type:complete len:860 (-),score=368.60 PLAT9066.1:1512-4091(-)